MYQVTADHDLPLILTKWCQNITIKLNHASVAMSGYCIVLYCIFCLVQIETERALAKIESKTMQLYVVQLNH